MRYELYFLAFMAVFGLLILIKGTLKTLYEEFKPDIEKLFGKKEKNDE